MKIVFLETTDSDSASHHSYNREEKGKTVFSGFFFVSRLSLHYLSTTLSFKARLGSCLSIYFFLLHANILYILRVNNEKNMNVIKC